MFYLFINKYFIRNNTPAVFDHLPLRTMSCRVHFPSSVSGLSRMQDLLPGTAFQITFTDHIRRQSTPATFRRHLKTFLFAEVFNTTYNF